jgi:predicted AAA+ superfamily ATPase
MLWNSVPAQLAKENKKFFYGMVRASARAKDFEAALQWLLGAGLIYKVEHVSKPSIPLSAYAESSFKLFTLDVGLLTAQCRLDAKTLLEGNAIFTEFKGALTEQYVQQQLRAECDILPNYWSSSSGNAEVDFLFQEGNDIIPVEVKAEENLRAKSMKTYVQRFSPKTAIRTSMSDYRRESWLINLPLYAIGQIQKECE